MAGFWCGEGGVVVEMGGTWRVPSQDSAEWREVGAAGLGSHSPILSLNVAPGKNCSWFPHGLYRCICGTACVRPHERSISLALPQLNVSSWSRLFIFISLAPDTEPSSLGECTGTFSWAQVPKGHVPGWAHGPLHAWMHIEGVRYAVCVSTTVSAGWSTCVWGRNPWGLLSLPHWFSISTSLVKEIFLLAGGRVY